MIAKMAVVHVNRSFNPDMASSSFANLSFMSAESPPSEPLVLGFPVK